MSSTICFILLQILSDLLLLTFIKNNFFYLKSWQDDPNIIIMPLNIIIILFNRIIMPLNSIIMPLNSIIMPLNMFGTDPDRNGSLEETPRSLIPAVDLAT